MSTDNPEVEPANQFYKPTETEEPLAPTEESVTKAESQEPQQEVKNLEKPAEVEAKAETKAEESEANDDEEDSQFIELDGKEISLSDVREGLNNGLMQKDYTKKTTELSEERKTFEAERTTERENLLKESAKVTEMRDMLTVLVAEDEAIEWAELKDDDPDEYIKQKELADKRKEALAKVKAERETPTDDPALIAAEQGKLFAANPDWFDDKGKHTDTYAADVKLMNEYAGNAGFSGEEFAVMTRAHHLQTILKAAKYDQLQDKGREIKAAREKVPVVTKPKATKQTGVPVAKEDVFYKPVANG
jgi:hypothetical protein